jgi:SCP-2 sterol transfer family
VLCFLSAEWLRAFDDALRADRRLGARFEADPIVIAQEITDDRRSVGSAASIRYVISLDGAGGRVDVGDAAPPADVTFVCDRETAAGLAQGTLNAQRALTSGRLKLRGEVDRLAAASGALAGLGDMLGPLRADTEF